MPSTAAGRQRCSRVSSSWPGRNSEIAVRTGRPWPAGAVEVVEEGLLLFQLQHAIHLRRLRAHAVGLQRLGCGRPLASRFYPEGRTPVPPPSPGGSRRPRGVDGARQHMGGSPAAAGAPWVGCMLTCTWPAGGTPGLQGQAAGAGRSSSRHRRLPRPGRWPRRPAPDGQAEDGAGQRAAVLVDRQQLSRCSSLPRGMPLASIRSARSGAPRGAGRGSRGLLGLANCMVVSCCCLPGRGARVVQTTRSRAPPRPLPEGEGARAGERLQSRGAGNGQQLGDGLVQHADQLVHILGRGARAAQGRVARNGVMGCRG